MEEHCKACGGVVDEDDYECPHCSEPLKPLMDEADEEEKE